MKDFIVKCSCGQEHRYIDKGAVIGVNEFGLWFNCECKSTNLVTKAILESLDCPVIKKLKVPSN